MAKLLLLFLTFAAHLQLSLQQDCSASQLCPIGCCSSSGFCGFGPDFCGTGCQSGCDRKADCNPGTWGGPEWSKSEKCPLNVCCSEYGFCGTTDEFCVGNPVERPSCNLNETPVTRVIGYYEAWSTTNRPCYSMLPESIPYGYYTDIIFSFATINPETFEIEAGDAFTAEYMQRISAIKLIQPDIRIWIAVGGWSFNDPGPTQTTFSDMAASATNTQKFIDSLILMMNKYGFDGIDVDWEYPVAEDRSGPGRGMDYDNFVTFMWALALRVKFGTHRKLVSLTLPASYWYLQHFDIVNLDTYVNWFNIMTYDMHGSWDIDNKWTGPYANSHSNMTEIQDALDLLWRNNVPPEKVTFGMAFYSRSFTLENQACNTPGCRVSSGGNAGPCSGTTGVLLHPEIADEIRSRGLTPTLHREAAVKSVSWGDQWVTFDDAATWRLKSNIIRSQCIQGVMVWAMSQDDKDGTNIKALTTAVGRKQMDAPDFSPSPQPIVDLPQAPRLCRWSGCYASCPDGFKTVQRFDHEEVMLNNENCHEGGVSFLCCPADQPMPTCSWRGHKNSGKCEPGCVPGIEVEVGSLGVGCRSGHQTACCSKTTSTEAYGKCKWVGCGETCPGDHPHKVVSAWKGAGGEPHCDIDESRSYCCSDPLPAEFKDCAWVMRGNPSRFNNEWICEDTCPSDQVKVATEISGGFTGFSNGCFTGAKAYCCKQPQPIVPRGDDDDDPFGGKQNKEFQVLLEDYMQNPTCPATILTPNPGNRFTHMNRRSLELEAAEHRFLHGRATDCKLDHFTMMVTFAAVMLTMSSSMLEPLQLVYDELFADNFDSELRAESLRTFYHDNPSMDPNSLMRYVFLNPAQAGRGIWRDRRTTAAFCQELPTTSTKRQERSVLAREKPSALASRFIYWMPGGDVGIPDMDTILEGIMNGDLSLHYARWQYIANQGGPMLELAYWIGPVPGQPGGDDRYRDTVTQNDGNPDRWVVMHLHINVETEWLRSFNGRTHVGVQSLRILHGHQTTTAGEGAWRVDNGDGNGRNSRDGMDCRDHRGLWYVGAPVNVPDESDATEADRLFWGRFRAWSDRLFNSGYVASTSLDLILTGTTRLANGDIDPEASFRVVRYREDHPGWGQSTYLLNWLIVDGGRFNFGPSEPPNQ